MATLSQSFVIFSFFLLLSNVDARLPRSSPEVSNSKIGLLTENSLDSGPGSVMNIEVGSQKNSKVPAMFSDELAVMPASGTFAGKKPRQDKEEFPIVSKWRPINRHLDRMRVIRRSFPVNCRHMSSRLDGGATIRSRIGEEKEDSIDGELPRHHRRYGKIISARWIDGTTFHQLDAVTIPDVVDGERMMIREFRNPRFIFFRNLRRHEHHSKGFGHFIWEKLRNFLINL